VHLLAATAGAIADGSEAVDLGQSPGDIVFLSAADSEIAGLARAQEGTEGARPSLRLANLMHLGHNLSVDLYVDTVVAKARLVVVRLLGGVNYWPYGVERIVACCRERDIPLALLPGDDMPDAELAGLCGLGTEPCHRLWQYCVQGGPANYRGLLDYAAALLECDTEWREPRPVLRAGLYWPDDGEVDLAALRRHWAAGRPVAALTFYRALLQADNLAPIDALVTALRRRGLNPLPIFVASLKDPVSAELVAGLLADTAPAVVLNCTGFAVSGLSGARRATPFDGAGCPVLQVVLAGCTEQHWRAGPNGLSGREIAMNVALPEVDGRLLSRVVSFKTEARFDTATESSIVRYRELPDRIDFTADLAAAWVRLAAAPAAERRVAFVLANYPNRDGRLGNGVGLDTPASLVTLLQAMTEAGYEVGAIPDDGNALIHRFGDGPTNQRPDRPGGERLPLADYRRFFDGLSAAVRDQVRQRWGAPEDDPFCGPDGFRLPIVRFGNVTCGIQPARGYNIDPAASYHDPDLPPPHGYFAFYAWLRLHHDAHAVVHLGKHGNMEWLPGKGVGLSRDCFPEAVFGPLPHLYPFIVNDPGEGTQAKRRAAAVIVDHLTPPMTRAGSYGPLAELELLVDEYYEAAGVDPRRLAVLRRQILDLSRDIGLDRDCGMAADDSDQASLGKLDNYLCELKEMQIRDGLHIFGQAPDGERLHDLLAALLRLPRGGKAADASLLRALAGDLGLNGFDPLESELGESWRGAKPEVLGELAAAPWRTLGDTVERLEMLAVELISGRRSPAGNWPATAAVLAQLDGTIRPAVLGSGEAEIAGLLDGLAGRFVPPGPSGAPTRGRPDTLPTGRNFYSVDSRTVPTPAAWHLGWKSAGLLLQRHRQEHGAWPRTLALSAWGTANMRTGGDDIAQALALLGVRPSWDRASRRVSGFEILPLDLLDRPRVDVLLRVSGFFRDAFPDQMALFDSAVRAVAALDEPAAMNPLAAQVQQDRQTMIDAGLTAEAAEQKAGYRLFGSKPGAYGAGLQALIDERGWRNDGDLARAYVAWGGYAYGAGNEGAAAHGLFEDRLRGVEAVVQNQDNREHDLLDSDDYYQFEGGITAAVRHLRGEQPATYHNDHSRPESPRIRTLEDEIGRVVRARVVNPKWLAGVMRHGYKGAFEMAATVDYLFAFAATARVVADHHFDAVYDAYLGDPAVRDFLLENNPAATREMAERLLEACERGLWRPRSNSLHLDLSALRGETEPATLGEMAND
jgi:cobaltochelatase CobN